SAPFSPANRTKLGTGDDVGPFPSACPARYLQPFPNRIPMHADAAIRAFDDRTMVATLAVVRMRGNQNLLGSGRSTQVKIRTSDWNVPPTRNWRATSKFAQPIASANQFLQHWASKPDHRCGAGSHSHSKKE